MEPLVVSNDDKDFIPEIRRGVFNKNNCSLVLVTKKGRPIHFVQDGQETKFAIGIDPKDIDAVLGCFVVEYKLRCKRVDTSEDANIIVFAISDDPNTTTQEMVCCC